MFRILCFAYKCGEFKSFAYFRAFSWCVCARKTCIDNELILKDYSNGISGNLIDTKINDANLIDCYTTNEIHQSKIESPQPLTSPSSSTTTTTTSTLFKRNKNPFLIGEMKHSDECTQSPMKICLVVSPPTNKLLQVCLDKTKIKLYIFAHKSNHHHHHHHPNRSYIHQPFEKH